MESIPVMLNGQTVGTVNVQQQGLFYRIDCRMRLPATQRHRLILNCDSGTMDLGLCVPVPEGSGLVTRIPVKIAGQGRMKFTLAAQKQGNAFVPVFEDKPFRHLERLEGARLTLVDGTVGVCFTEVPP